jgi:uncharacterized protein YjbI with pentapeptide repeats
MTKPAASDDMQDVRLDVRGAFLRRTDLSDANLQRANLSAADFTNAVFKGADFKEANLERTILRGADLTGAKNLTVAQLRAAVLDESTKLPDYISSRDVLGHAERG